MVARESGGKGREGGGHGLLLDFPLMALDQGWPLIKHFYKRENGNDGTFVDL